MRYSQSAAALVAALSVSSVAAGPTRRHVHHQHHQKKDVDWAKLDWAHMGIDWASAYSAGIAAQATATPAPTPTSTSSEAAAVFAAGATSSPAAADPIQAAASAVASAVDTVVSDILGGVIGFANDITSFGSEVAAKGATGDNYYGNCGKPYGHNMMKVSDRSSYSYTIEFQNTSKDKQSIYIWNKVGSDGQVLSGSALAPSNTALTFVLAAGASQIVAFQENSQIGWAQACTAKAASGAFATTWGEANFVKTGSGYDVSAIMNPNNNNYDMSISSVEAPACTSDRTQNFWLTATDPVGNSDGSCYIAQNTATLTVKMGGTI